MANRKEPSAAYLQPKAELTTDPLRRRDSAASRTDATDKGNPSNQRNPWFGILSAAADSKGYGTHTCTHGSAQLCGHRTSRISDPAPLEPSLQLRRHRGVRCILIVRPLSWLQILSVHDSQGNNLFIDVRYQGSNPVPGISRQLISEYQSLTRF